jgi:hypothetical protein
MLPPSSGTGSKLEADGRLLFWSVCIPSDMFCVKINSNFMKFLQKWAHSTKDRRSIQNAHLTNI